MDKYECADTKEGYRVAQIRKHIFEKLKHILKYEVPDALRLPIRLPFDKTYRDILYHKQNRRYRKRYGAYLIRYGRRTAHKAGSEIYAGQIHQKSRKSVLTEQCFTELFTLYACVNIKQHCNYHKPYAYTDSY